MTASAEPNYRAQQKAETRRLLLDVARELLREKGYDGMTMRQLATRAGVGLGTAFKHFPAKGSLVIAVYRDEIYVAADAMFDSLPAKGIEAQLVHLVRCLYSFFSKRPALTRAMVNEATGLDGESAELSLRQMGEFLAEVRKLLEAARSNGELRVNLDLDDAVSAFFSFYYAGLVAGFTVPGVGVDERVARVARLLRQHMLGMAAVQEATPTRRTK